MALIDCPQCGHKVLSVASTCPECGFSLSEQRKRDSHTGSVALCRHCHREMTAGSKLCPHCGETKPVTSPLRWLIPAVLVLAGLAAVFLIPWGSSEGPEPAAPIVDSETVAVPQDTIPTPPPADDTAPTTPEPVAPAGPQTLTRWTSTWANMREQRDVDSEIVVILQPGTQIEVAELESRWWAVYVDGRLVGYVSAMLVVDRPPGEEPDTGR